ncbi:unnamed protein product [Boreogadus saida]
MPPSPLDDRIVVALPRPVRPQELQLRLDASYLDAIAINSGGGSGSSSSSSSSSSSRRTSSTSISSISTSISSISSISSTSSTGSGGGGGKTIVSSTTLVQIRSTTDLVTYMPSSNGSTRSLSCGCSSASCCSVSTYERDARAHAHHGHGHRHAPSQVSASSPNLSYAGPSSPSPAPTALGSHGAGSTPSLSSTGPPRAQHSFRVVHPNELARRLACCPVGHPVAGPLPVVVDCRPFTEYNKGHVRGAVHINCSDKISRRRLQQGKVTVLELVSCREAKDSFRGGVFARDLVVYDDSTSDPARLAPSQPLSVVLESLRREGKDPIVLKGRPRVGADVGGMVVVGVVVGVEVVVVGLVVEVVVVVVLVVVLVVVVEVEVELVVVVVVLVVVVLLVVEVEEVEVELVVVVVVVLVVMVEVVVVVVEEMTVALHWGLHAFRQCHEHLCDHSLRLHEGPNGGGGGGGPGAAAALAGHAVGPLASMPDIENAELTAILPLLYLGNERDARDLAMLRRANIGFVLNVTTHLPLFHYDTGLFCYKRLPATDSNKQNLRQYFEEAFEFIEEAHQAGMGLLIHCQAGVSRSATIVIAYLMKHTWMTMTDAYKFVKARRAIISPNLNFMGQLLEFEEDLNSGITPRILTPKLMGVETMV